MQKLLTFFQQKYYRYAIFNDQRFNDMLTNDIVSFEQLGPEIVLHDHHSYHLICSYNMFLRLVWIIAFHVYPKFWDTLTPILVLNFKQVHFITWCLKLLDEL